MNLDALLNFAPLIAGLVASLGALITALGSYYLNKYQKKQKSSNDQFRKIELKVNGSVVTIESNSPQEINWNELERIITNFNKSAKLTDVTPPQKTAEVVDSNKKVGADVNSNNLPNQNNQLPLETNSDKDSKDQQTYLLHFEDISQDEGNNYAEELSNILLDVSPEIVVDRRPSDQYTQNFSNTLRLLLNTPSILAVANGISNWLMLHSKASLTIATADNKIIAKNISGKDAKQLAELLLTHQKDQT